MIASEVPVFVFSFKASRYRDFESKNRDFESKNRDFEFLKSTVEPL
jgi:hypothetical protein